MADNSTLTHRSKRNDIREILQNAYTINPDLDECGNFKSLGNADTSLTLPPAVPGRVYRFYVGGTGGCLVFPVGTDRILDNGVLLPVGVSVTSYALNSTFTLYCRRYGIWIMTERIGNIGTFDDSFDTTFD